MAGDMVRPDRGGSVLEYAVVIALVAGLALVLAAPLGLGRTIASHIDAVICRALNSDNCGSPEGAESADANEGAGQGGSGDGSLDSDISAAVQQQQGTLTEAEIRQVMEEVDELLASTSVGQDTLDFLTEQSHPVINLPVHYGEDPTSIANGSYCPLTNPLIFMEAGRDPEDVAATLAHEVQHRRDHVNGDLPAPADFADEDDYVEAMAATEARGRSAQIGFTVTRKMQRGEDIPEWSEHITINSSDQAMSYLEHHYREAYLEAMSGPERGSTDHAHDYARGVIEELMIPLYLDDSLGGFGGSYRGRWEDQWALIPPARTQEGEMTLEDMRGMRDCEDGLPPDTVLR